MRDAKGDINDERRGVRRGQRVNKITKQMRRQERTEASMTREQRMSGERREKRERGRDDRAYRSVTRGHTGVNSVERKRCATPSEGTTDVCSH